MTWSDFQGVLENASPRSAEEGLEVLLRARGGLSCEPRENGGDSHQRAAWGLAAPGLRPLQAGGGGIEDASRAPDMSTQVSTIGQARRSWKGGQADNGSVGACGT